MKWIGGIGAGAFLAVILLASNVRAAEVPPVVPKNEHELQSYFINRVGKFLEARGKKFMGWDEILNHGLSPNAGVMSWRGMRGGLVAARTGRQAVMTPTSHCYFDYSYKSIDTRKAYSFEPVPDSVKEEIHQDGRRTTPVLTGTYEKQRLPGPAPVERTAPDLK
jgi:hypothetical protein